MRSGPTRCSPSTSSARRGTGRSPTTCRPVRREVITVDHRGLGRSTPSLACPEVERLAGSSLAAPINDRRTRRRCSQRCSSAAIGSSLLASSSVRTTSRRSPPTPRTCEPRSESNAGTCAARQRSTHRVRDPPTARRARARGLARQPGDPAGRSPHDRRDRNEERDEGAGRGVRLRSGASGASRASRKRSRET